jgi:hypothetical protein
MLKINSYAISVIFAFAVYILLAYINEYNSYLSEFFKFFDKYLLPFFIGMLASVIFERLLVDKIAFKIKNYSEITQSGIRSILYINSYSAFFENKLKEDSGGGNIKFFNLTLEEVTSVIRIFSKYPKWRIQILIMHPEENIFEYRLSEYDAFYADDRQYIYDSINKGSNEIPKNVEILFYKKQLPGVPIIILNSNKFGNTVYNGYYLNERSRENPYICWGDCILSDKMEKYFDKKWDRVQKESGKMDSTE